MLDVKALRGDFETIQARLAKRGKDFRLERFLELDKQKRAASHAVETLQSRQNSVSKQVPVLKKQGEDVSALLAEMKALSDQIKALEADLRGREAVIQDFLLNIPNAPHDSVPAGLSEADNVEIRRHGEPPAFAFPPKPHWEIGEALDIIDAPRAAKTTGARFTLYKGPGATLERAVINFMLDTHLRAGYTEVAPPALVHTRSMYGTGQLPKFAEDMFKVADTDYYLAPTAEVPVTNMYREEILDGAKLPLRYCAYAPCFRAEAGSAGRDTRGLIRQHQFNKVELVKFAKPEDSYAELESMTASAEAVLRQLGLAYRVVLLCAGDMGFAAAKTYDIEVWMPSYGRYVEISSCSNCEAYQARRAQIRYKDSPGSKAQFVHTLNGSGVAAGRTTAAILENFQQSDGSVAIPAVLVPYMGGQAVIPQAANGTKRTILQSC